MQPAPPDEGNYRTPLRKALKPRAAAHALRPNTHPVWAFAWRGGIRTLSHRFEGGVRALCRGAAIASICHGKHAEPLGRK
ncbi:MAG: hypothetical protein PHE09_13285 [Oscillospiraceae bacterium]|nr:hypothetical protein [Oscillospiraceae bacterium]